MHDSGKRLTILTAKEIQELYGLPTFTPEERDFYFSLNPLEKQALDRMRGMAARSNDVSRRLYDTSQTTDGKA